MLSNWCIVVALFKYYLVSLCNWKPYRCESFTINFIVSAQFIIMAEEIHVIKKRQKVRVMECVICKITHISHIILSPICLIHPEEKNTKKYITTLLRMLSCYIHKHNISSNHFIIFHKCSYYFLPHLLR